MEVMNESLSRRISSIVRKRYSDPFRNNGRFPTTEEILEVSIGMMLREFHILVADPFFRTKTEMRDYSICARFYHVLPAPMHELQPFEFIVEMGVRLAMKLVSIMLAGKDFVLPVDKFSFTIINVEVDVTGDIMREGWVITWYQKQNPEPDQLDVKTSFSLLL